MTAFIALLRAVNVGGTGKLAMNDLRALCEDAGFENVRTYIQSGNAVFASKLAKAKVKATLEAALTAHMGKPAAVIVRSAKEMSAILKANPFPGAPGNRVMVHFLDKPLAKGAVDGLTGPDGEEVKAKGRDVYIRYSEGMAHSKLKLPFAKQGTARNMNTVAKLAAMAGEI
jgi:uncharacterized protein (DUF1697 family)